MPSTGFTIFVGFNFLMGSIVGPLCLFAPRYFFDINKLTGVMLGDKPADLDLLLAFDSLTTRFLGAAVVTLETTLCAMILQDPADRKLYLLAMVWMLATGAAGGLYFAETGLRAILPLFALSCVYAFGYWRYWCNPPVGTGEDNKSK
jgi:hypothetical protein